MQNYSAFKESFPWGVWWLSKKFFQEYHPSVNSLDPDQAQHRVGPDLGPNCLQKLSVETLSRQRKNSFLSLWVQYAWKQLEVEQQFSLDYTNELHMLSSEILYCITSYCFISKTYKNKY